MKVFLAVNCPGADLPGLILDYATRLIAAGASGALPYAVSLHPTFAKSVAHAENSSVGQFLASDADVLWFLAADAVPYPDTHRVLDVDADVALGWSLLQRGRVQDPTSLRIEQNVYREIDDAGFAFLPVPVATDGAPIEAILGGMHCAAIRRHVLEDRRLWLSHAWVDHCGRPRVLSPETDEDYAPPVFRTEIRPDGRVGRTDDVDFCWRVRQLGYRVVAAPAALSGHLKDCDLVALVGHVTATAAAALQARAAESAPAGAAHSEQEARP